MKELVILFIYSLELYFIAGVIFSLIFYWKGLIKMDAETRGTSIWFKLLIFPGTCALWPVLLIKWYKL